jgi:hypothetical protein
MFDFLKTKEDYPERKVTVNHISVIVFKPDIAEKMRWHEYHELVAGYIKDIQATSRDFIQYVIMDWKEVDAFPVFERGWNFSSSTDYTSKFIANKIPATSCDYLGTLKKFYGADYPKYDEIWMFGGPYFGFYESRMVGKNPIWCNAPELKTDTHNQVVMGFNYERGVGEMLENYCHRVESTMNCCENYIWKQFLKDCGSVHCPPNTTKDYDWGNTDEVSTNCDAWHFWPDYQDRSKVTNCREWGMGEIRAHHIWWLQHIYPNWFRYVNDLSIIDEHRADFALRNLANSCYYQNKFSA